MWIVRLLYYCYSALLYYLYQCITVILYYCSIVVLYYCMIVWLYYYIIVLYCIALYCIVLYFCMLLYYCISVCYIVSFRFVCGNVLIVSFRTFYRFQSFSFVEFRFVSFRLLVVDLSFRFGSFRLPIVLSFRFVWFPCLVHTDTYTQTHEDTGQTIAPHMGWCRLIHKTRSSSAEVHQSCDHTTASGLSQR